MRQPILPPGRIASEQTAEARRWEEEEHEAAAATTTYPVSLPIQMQIAVKSRPEGLPKPNRLW